MRRTLPTVAVGLAVLGTVVARPLAWGVTPVAAVGFWLTALVLVVLPGAGLCRAAGLCPGEDHALLVGQGATLGLAIQGLSFLAGRATGIGWLAVALPLAVAAIGFLRPRRVGAPFPKASAVVLLVALVAVLVQPLFSVRATGDRVPVDMLFHAGNAAELRHRWPPQSPRVAGEALNYPMLAYALSAQSSELVSSPVADSLLGVAPLFWVALLALQIANAGRILFRDGVAGVIAAALVLLHADPGAVLGFGPGAFNSYLGTGLYGSPTTVCGLILLTGMAIALARWLEGSGRAELGASALLAAAAAATKASVLPPVLGGLAVVAVWHAARRERAPLHRAAGALVVLATVAAPFVLSLASGASSYRGVFSWDPGAAFVRSAFGATFLGRLGTLPLLHAVLFAAWLLIYLGLAGIFALVWLWLRAEPLGSARVWALGLVATGLGSAMLVGTPDLSQLFFAYDAQVLLAMFAGSALCLAARQPLPRRSALLVVAAVLSWPSVDWVARQVPASLRRDAVEARRRPEPVTRDYLGGLSWLRRNAVTGAVVFADDPALLLSAFGETRVYYENGLYSPRWWQAIVHGTAEAYPDRVALETRLLRHPDADAIAAARRAVGPGQRILVVADHVPSRILDGFVLASPAAVPPGRLFPDPLFRLLFANQAMHVYEASDAGSP